MSVNITVDEKLAALQLAKAGVPIDLAPVFGVNTTSPYWHGQAPVVRFTPDESKWFVGEPIPIDPVLEMFPSSDNWPDWKKTMAKNLIAIGNSKAQIAKVFKAIRRVKVREKADRIERERGIKLANRRRVKCK